MRSAFTEQAEVQGRLAYAGLLPNSRSIRIQAPLYQLIAPRMKIPARAEAPSNSHSSRLPGRSLSPTMLANAIRMPHPHPLLVQHLR